jgi:hypothetical protein
VVSGTWKIDELVPITLNNFPQLVSRFEELTRAELLGNTDGTRTVDVSRYSEVSVEEAWRLHQAKMKPARENMARRRQVEMRASAVAAETAIVSSQVESRRAPTVSQHHTSLITLRLTWSRFSLRTREEIGTKSSGVIHLEMGSGPRRGI